MPRTAFSMTSTVESSSLISFSKAFISASSVLLVPLHKYYKYIYNFDYKNLSVKTINSKDLKITKVSKHLKK